ncbi:hypothetical protein C7N43_32525 [Sphingobacteriales bacterium UPWRP_1]|nr:hypothetical protein C7N43_32525 [Sphingobacteriales bacterium UPWRP_1]
MLSDKEIVEKLHQLPPVIQQEVLDFIDFLTMKWRNQGLAKSETYLRKAGAMPNLVAYMADDFDAPLEDLNDYQ